MLPVPSLSFSHMGLFVNDAARMQDFYTRVLGFAVTDRGILETADGPLTLVFLSRDPREHHQIVLASGRPAKLEFNSINQISFRLQREPVSQIAPICHGNALSVYFRDPEGNRMELFLDTPWYARQPLRIPMDLQLPDSELWAWTEAQARQQPDFKPVEQWRAEIEARMRP